MAAILQFWTDEASITDGKLFGGRTHPVSALVEYVMNAVNLVLPLGYKVTWESCHYPCPVDEEMALQLHQ